MYKSIQQFIEKDIKEIEKVLGKILTNEKDADDLSKEVMDRAMTLSARLLGELYEQLDDEIKKSVMRKRHWNVEQTKQTKEILDIVGPVRFERTGYVDKRTGKYIYLLDQVLGIEKNQKMTLGAAADVLEESIMSSYAKGGRAASRYDAASKQTVKNLVHKTMIQFPIAVPAERKQIRNLHIVADEDHVSAQYQYQKGDLPKDKNGRTINTIMPKLIVVYEDVINEAGDKSEHPRYKLIGKRVFSGVHKGTNANYKFWEEVRKYIECTYDTTGLERIYIAGDGASWIKAGIEVLEKSRFVLDKFHMMKYINLSVTHLLDSTEDAKEEIWECINGANKQGIRDVYQKILAVTEKDSKKYEEVEGALRYLINNWPGIEIRKAEPGGCWKCCAEGQVSHILSDRMSSRPMGWSEHGCDQMAKLRAYHWNNGKVIDILKYQKKKKGQEEHRQEQEELIKELRERHGRWNYAEETRELIPGLEKHSMKWLRSMIYQALDA